MDRAPRHSAMVERAGPVALRQAMDSATALMKAGVMFVAIPVTSQDDMQQLRAESLRRLERMAQEAEEVES
ncbi:hypothetical protein D3C85_1163850 [compost metagenome]